MRNKWDVIIPHVDHFSIVNLLSIIKSKKKPTINQIVTCQNIASFQPMRMKKHSMRSHPQGPQPGSQWSIVVVFIYIFHSATDWEKFYELILGTYTYTIYLNNFLVIVYSRWHGDDILYSRRRSDSRRVLPVSCTWCPSGCQWVRNPDVV
jgi:hypothetical protein